MVTLALIQGVVNTFVMFFSRVIGPTIDRVVFKTERGHGIGFYIVTFIAEMILGILASAIVFWFSRRREFERIKPVPTWPMSSHDRRITTLARGTRFAHGHARHPDGIRYPYGTEQAGQVVYDSPTARRPDRALQASA